MFVLGVYESSGGSKISQLLRSVRQPTILHKLCRKLHENERIWTERGCTFLYPLLESPTGKKNSYLCPENPFIDLTGSEDTNKFGLKDQMRSCTRSIDRFSLSLHELLVLRSMLFWKEQHMRSLNNTYNDSAHFVSKRLFPSFGQKRNCP